MRYEHTPALTLALRRASALARQAGRAAITPRDLLHGLLSEEEGKPAVYLARAGVAADHLKGLPGSESSVAGDTDPLPIDDATADALREARALAHTHSDEGTVATDQLLLAVLEQAPELRQELAAAGLDFPHLRGQVVGEGPPTLAADPYLLDEEPEPLNVARVVDAGANRAREALRVLEDYARFVLDDTFLTGQLKALRHDLTALLEPLPPYVLLSARDTQGDVGTALSTTGELNRADTQAVVLANAKRLQEALRSLEEFGKTLLPELGGRLEQMRYRSYTLERALVLGGLARDRLADARLYVLVTDALCRASLVGTVKEAVLGGAQVIQLREKAVDDRTLLERAREVRAITREHGVLFIVNDRPDIALASEADGVHLGEDDLPVQAARRVLGPRALIGVSTHDVEQVRRAVLDGASYLGVGPTFPSKTKGFEAFAGLEFVRQAAAETSLPAFVLGGVTLENVGEVLAAGGRRIAVSHAICAADDARAVAARFRAALSNI